MKIDWRFECVSGDTWLDSLADKCINYIDSFHTHEHIARTWRWTSFTHVLRDCNFQFNAFLLLLLRDDFPFHFVLWLLPFIRCLDEFNCCRLSMTTFRTRFIYVFSSVSISYAILPLNDAIDNTYSVWMLFIESNVPFASDWMLLSYNDNKLKLVKSRNESFRMHDISLAFSNNNCNDVNPRNTFAGKSLILLPYKTLFAKFSKEETEMVDR